MIEETIRTRLLAISGVTDLVGSRIYVDKLPQSPTYPCIRITMVTEGSDYHLRGEDSLHQATVQVDAFAREVSGVDPYGMAQAVAQAVNGDGAGSGLSGWSDTAARVDGVFRAERRRSYDPDELRVLTMSQDYRVLFRA